MSTIIISPLGDVSTTSAEVVELQIVVSDDDFSGLFDVLELWRSKTGQDGPYEELTASGPKRARIPKDASDPPTPAVTGALVNIDTKILLLLIDEETQVPITFAGIDPIDFATLAPQVTTQGLTLVEAYVAEDGRFVVQTTDSGLSARLRTQPGDTTLGTDAATILGLPTAEPLSLAFGKAARIPLVLGKNSYTFTDPHSDRAYFYKTRFRNTLSAAVSEFSLPFGVGLAVGVDQDNIVCGRADLVSMDGKPLRNAEVRLHVSFNGTVVDDKVVAGGDRKALTDENGRVEFNLVRGQLLTVAIIGTDLAREITVPTDPAVKIFNLLDPSIVTGDDVFKVQVPDLVVAERRTL